MNKQGKLRGWHVLAMLIGFFGVIFAVNGVFVFQALKSFPGEDVRKSYVQGINYNETLEERRAQAALGWRAAIGIDEELLVVELTREDGGQLTGKAMIGELRRTIDDEDDRAVVFRSVGAGRYVAEVGALAPGEWRIRVQVLEGENADRLAFAAYKTLIVP